MAHLSPETAKLIPDWARRKRAQYARIRDALPGGVRYLAYGPGQSTVMLSYRCPETGFCEGLLIAQLPRVELEPKVQSPKDRKDFRLVPEMKKRVENQMIDLFDEDIDMVIECWRRGRSALELEFVPAVWDGNGKRYLAPRRKT